MKIVPIGLLGAALVCSCVQQVLAAEIPRFRETVLYSFQELPDAESPYSGLVYLNGMLYGTTVVGGAYGNDFDYGAAYSINPKTGAETVLHSFGNGLDGEYPYSSLIAAKGILYGTTDSGGTFGKGTVFAIDPGTGAETVLHSFGMGTDGQLPYSAVIDVKGTLYGTTRFGGTYDNGAVFALDLSSGAETVLYSFGNSPDGQVPLAGLLHANGVFYGTTEAGGAYDLGTVFAFDPNTGAETVIHSFAGGADGSYPWASPISVKGVLYGTSSGGGVHGTGALYELDPNTGTETVVHSFGSGADGQIPYAGLIAAKHILYGTTFYGGILGKGAVFAFDLDANSEKVLHSFRGRSGGENPSAELIEVNGALYATTQLEGANDLGTVFVLSK